MAGKYKKIVIVTGGSSGIGRCTASALRDSGCIVYEFSRRNIPMEGITHLSVDVTDENAVNSAVKQIIQKETKIDAVINCAGFGISDAIGHGDILGSVEEGMKADLILVNIEQPHITPTQNLVNTIVDAANGHDVMDSIINGKLVMKNREVLTLDEERIRFEATQHMNEIIKRAY